MSCSSTGNEISSRDGQLRTFPEPCAALTSSQDGNPPYFADGAAGVGLTDIEARYNITEQLQFAISRPAREQLHRPASYLNEWM